MLRRKKDSGGQAIVMVTLALITMSGMMGLAVDLGWSYFTQKAAQAAADDAALSAVVRAYKSVTAGGGVATSFSACGTMGVTCAATPVACDPGNSGLGNLQSGCLYARNDGFTPGGHGGKQNVLIEANIPSVALPDSIPTNPSSPRDMVYWVTVRTYERIPQLFSAVLGNKDGAIAAVATAAIASKVVPGSFWGMNKKGDCRIASGQAITGFLFTGCGVDIDVAGVGNGAACGSSGVNAYLCAPAGVVLSSTCTSSGQAGCADSTSTPATTTGNNYGGHRGKVYGGPAILTAAAGAAGGLTAVPTPTVGGNPVDPFATLQQPPLAASAGGSTQPIGSCGYPGGVIPAGTTEHLGPYQYYSYRTVTVSGAAVKIPDALPIQLPNNAVFDPAATGCPGGGVFTPGGNSQSSNSSFPSYIMYGGINVDGRGTVTFGAGQYVFAGVNSTTGNSVNGATGGPDNVIAAKNTDFVGAGVNSLATDKGIMMILTDGKYPGLSTQLAGIPNSVCTAATCGVGNISKIDPAQTDPTTGENWLVQGSVQVKNVDMTLDGYNKNNAPLGTMDAYNGVLLWQDRRNSTVIYDSAGSVVKCYLGCANTPTAADYQANNVTASSPGLSMSDGLGRLILNGAIYQPRGAWYAISPGTAGVDNSPLQIVNGQLICGSTGGPGCGNTAVTLLGPTVDIITYLPVLIQ